MQCEDDVLLSCTLATCMVLPTNVTPMNSIKTVISRCYEEFILHTIHTHIHILDIFNVYYMPDTMLFTYRYIS